MLTRVYAVSDQAQEMDPVYMDRLRTAVSAAISYGLDAIETDEDPSSSPPPQILIAQARIAARSGVRLDMVLRRYVVGHALIGDFLVEEAERIGMKGALQSLLRAQTEILDRLLVAVSAAYNRETSSRRATPEERRVKRVEGLLAGELLDTSELPYDFEGSHLGAIAAGRGAEEAVRALAAKLSRRLLLIRRDESGVWAWLGAHKRAAADTLDRALSAAWPTGVSIAIGEPGEGLAGWRLTHHQALAALPIALRDPRTPVCYADVALLASMLQDDLLATSLRELYLKPLERAHDGGAAAIETLRAYFEADRNISSAAAALGVSRQAVSLRLRTIEGALGRRLTDCAMELEAAIRIDELRARDLTSKGPDDPSPVGAQGHPMLARPNPNLASR